MTCSCWRPYDHQIGCELVRERERRDAAFELLLAPMLGLAPAVAREAEAERPREPMGGWEPRT